MIHHVEHDAARDDARSKQVDAQGPRSELGRRLVEARSAVEHRRVAVFDRSPVGERVPVRAGLHPHLDAVVVHDDGRPVGARSGLVVLLHRPDQRRPTTTDHRRPVEPQVERDHLATSSPAAGPREPCSRRGDATDRARGLGADVISSPSLTGIVSTGGRPVPRVDFSSPNVYMFQNAKAAVRSRRASGCCGIRGASSPIGVTSIVPSEQRQEDAPG